MTCIRFLFCGYIYGKVLYRSIVFQNEFMYKMWWQVTICCQNCKWQEHHLFHTQLWFPASDHDFWWFGSDFWSFCKAITEKKHCGRNRIDRGRLCETEFTLESLYSTEIWNTNSLWWPPFHTGAHDGFSVSVAVQSVQGPVSLTVFP